MIYFNEFDPFAAAWLSKLYPLATIDKRSIKDVEATDTLGFTRCHFFGGIGGWEYALELAGWPADREVWTGSCPCQPFSSAGKQKGTADERHLWPEFLRLIAERRPATIFGEQVASPLGREWLAGVFADLEKLGYAVAGADLCAASVGAPHIRQRLFWLADTQRERAGPGITGVERYAGSRGNRSAIDSTTRGLADASGDRGPQQFGESGERTRREAGPDDTAECAGLSGLGNAAGGQPGDGSVQRGGEYGLRAEGRRGDGPEGIGQRAEGFWSDFDLIPCRDGKTRRIEPGTFPLAHGVPARVGRLRGYGNAIVPQVAAEFIRAFLEL